VMEVTETYRCEGVHMSHDKPAAPTSQDQRNWGTPDPRDGAAYPDPNSTSPAQWAWELLRRRADFRKAWIEIAEPFCDPKTGEPDEARIMRAQNLELYVDSRGYVRTDVMLPPYVKLSPDGKKLSMTHPLKELADRFDLQLGPQGRLDPRRDERPGFLTNVVRAHPWGNTDAYGPTVVKTKLEHCEVLIRFNVAHPLDMQLEQARSMLEHYARRAKSEPADRRPRWDMFPLYLRVLDAEAAGMSDAEAAKILFPNATNVHPEYYGSQHVRNARKAAKRWQSEYLFVACAS
jgi:hypothetical protein